ncbi:MAG: SUMF1/EgtB/PvdO family nonheme iron enzyme, partial [Verrucomicrobia bacterium]|nr:SUMF1/EgtB/PvdO family nonheme iron enzyme [Verrucomicrobiota bacterium]
MRITIKNISATLAALVVTVLTDQAAVPTLNYEINGDNLVITYTGTLLQSSDAVNWTEVSSATSPYKIVLGDKKSFFCVKWGETGENVIVPLAENVDMEMVWIEPGSFMMGSPEDELGREDREIQHQVTISKGFWIGKYEVTQAQYKAVTGKNIPVEMSAVYPAGSINWSDAMDFCDKLTQSEQDAARLPKGYRYTLPTAAQWEYACRAGTTTSLNSGKNITSVNDFCPNMDEVGWYHYNASGRTQPVGQKLANNWGLYDMEGNLWEWVSDWFGYYTASAVSDPVGAVFGTERTLRGGSWYNYQNMCRSAFFINYNPAAGNSDFGFRVVLTADPNAMKDLGIAFAGYSASESTVILRFTKGLDPVMAEDVLNYSITDKFTERVKVKKADYEKEKYRVTLSFDKDYDLLFGDVLDVTVSNAVTDTGDAIPEDLTATVNINKYPLKSLYYDTGDINTLKTYVAEGKKADWLEEMPVVDYGQYYSWRCDYLAGWLTAPETGKYSIWFYNDYSGELWLSSDDTKEGLGDTPLIIGTYAEVRSSGLIELVAGQRYYFEIYHKSDGVPNLTILSWVRPSQNPEYIIPETLSSALPYNYGIPEPIETEYLSGIDVEPLIDMAPAILRQPL